MIKAFCFICSFLWLFVFLTSSETSPLLSTSLFLNQFWLMTALTYKGSND